MVVFFVNSVCSGGSSRCKFLKLNGSMEDFVFIYFNDLKFDLLSLFCFKYLLVVIEDIFCGDELYK